MYAIADAMGVSRRRVQQLHQSAIEKLRVGLAKEGIDAETFALIEAARRRTGKARRGRRIKTRKRKGDSLLYADE